VISILDTMSPSICALFDRALAVSSATFGPECKAFCCRFDRFLANVVGWPKGGAEKRNLRRFPGLVTMDLDRFERISDGADEKPPKQLDPRIKPQDSRDVRLG